MSSSQADPIFLDNVLLFLNMLRRAGIPVSTDQAIDFARALEMIDIGRREQLYYAARGLLLNRYENMRLFDTIFNRFWRVPAASSGGRRQKAPIAPRHQPKPATQFNIVTYMAYRARQSDPEIDVADKSQTFSDAELLQTKEFSAMTPEELTAVKQLIREMRWQISLRQTRRRVPDGKGDLLHLRASMRSATKHGGVPLHLSWQRKKIKQRPLVLLADISGSMEKYTRLLLQFFYAVSHSLQQVESFVFGTSLSRITPHLKIKNIDRALDEASRRVVDWSSGTRIGPSLQAFNRQWSRRVLRQKGAIVLIISDGWERGDVSLIKQEMAYLRRRCHRLIWLNPLLGKATYQPLVEGMAAALPFVDDFLPIHNLQSLNALADHLGSLDARRSVRPATAGLRSGLDA
ncbi:MAG: VWA domain-containing protein [Anaerolineae bacterium]|nr:VWA domain-containing protein [Anaerolineae bacterium]